MLSILKRVRELYFRDNCQSDKKVGRNDIYFIPRSIEHQSSDELIRPSECIHGAQIRICDRTSSAKSESRHKGRTGQEMKIIVFCYVTPSSLVTDVLENHSATSFSVEYKTAWGQIPEDIKRHTHRRESLKSCSRTELSIWPACCIKRTVIIESACFTIQCLINTFTCYIFYRS